jgi:hypothetical protein
MCIFVWFFIPETKGLFIFYFSRWGIWFANSLAGMSLEKMDELFGVTQLLDHKNADAERASISEEAGKTSQAHVERVA